MSFLNTLLSPESTYVEIIDSFKAATEILWNKCEDNNPISLNDDASDRDSESEEAFEIAIANMYSKRF